MITDILGNEIKVGSYIAYGQALGRCAGLNIGKVLATKEFPDKWCPEKNECRIKILGLGNFRASTLMFPSRMVVIDSASISTSMLMLLDGTEVKE